MKDIVNRNRQFDSCPQGHGKIVDELLKNGADINIQNKDGETPAFMAIKNGREDVAEKLFKINANVNLKNNDGYTVLHIAVTDGN